MIPASLCVRCKGRLWCALSNCPILKKFLVRQQTASIIQTKQFLGSSPPSVFVSWPHYPHVSIAPLAPPVVGRESALLDNPQQWFGLPAEKIVQMRARLIQSKKPIITTQAANPPYELVSLQELALARQPVEASFQLNQKPRVNLSFFEGTAPIGPVALLKKMVLQENPRIPSKVDYLVSDTAVKSQTAVQELYEDGLPVHYLSRILSVGALGIKKNRRLVPTRWSITAIDNNVSAYLVNELVKDFQQIGEIELFHAHYLGNSFFVVLIPSNWSFEMMECWLPGSPWTLEDPVFQRAQEFNIIIDFEFYGGRKSYASAITGAYYAARLAVAEHLVKQKRQAAVVVFREISADYTIPLGVWVIRETVRQALQKKPLAFSSLELCLQYLKFRLKAPLKKYKKTSQLLAFLQNQKKLLEWIK